MYAMYVCSYANVCMYAMYGMYVCMLCDVSTSCAWCVMCDCCCLVLISIVGVWLRALSCPARCVRGFLFCIIGLEFGVVEHSSQKQCSSQGMMTIYAKAEQREHMLTCAPPPSPVAPIPGQRETM